MELVRWLKMMGFKFSGEFKHKGIILSTMFAKDTNLVIVDNSLIFETDFSYKRYCQKQNEWMKRYQKVYRFIDDDIEMAKFFLFEEDADFSEKRTINREIIIVDPTPLEYIFENCFRIAYGEAAYKYLKREYSFILKNGDTSYIDYALFHKEGHWIAIEENGIRYHHPFIIKKERYRKILQKQNSVIDQNGIVYRWDTESIQNIDRIVDEVKEFIGSLDSYINQIYYKNKRSFKLYEHQNEYISKLSMQRENNANAVVIVLPVGTGKTTVALLDLQEFLVDKEDSKVLVLVPTLDLKIQWQKEIDNIFNINSNNIIVKTYSKVCREYMYDSSNKYQYIIFDEAHHAVAPTMKKVLNHYNPKFLLGLTATDKRLDKKKLEDVFGNYDITLSLKQAVEKGILCPIRSYRLETNIDLSQVKFNGKDYVNSQLERQIKIPSRNQVIADVIKEYFYDKLKGKSGIVFCVSVNHAKDMAETLRWKGIKAESVDGSDKNRFKKIEKYMNREVQILCTCSLLTEGWDAPHTSVIVMARPTLSKVLYIQQLGRGTRKAEGKEALYVIDVVDQYGSLGSISNRPWSLHALLELYRYKPFEDIIANNFLNEELVILDTIYEKTIKLDRFDIYTFEQMYGDYLSEEELARELFVSTGTVKNWIRKKDIIPDVVLPLGRGKISLFNPNKIEEIRTKKDLSIHSENTIAKDFWNFIDKADYTFSYKMYFLLSLLDTVDETGDALTEDVLNEYVEYYNRKHKNNETVDKNNSPYNKAEYINDKRIMMQSMLMNPFEKFERKRFMYYNKDLAKLSIHHLIWEDFLENNGIDKLRKTIENDLIKYYEKL